MSLCKLCCVLTVTSLESWLKKGNHPKWPFRLVIYSIDPDLRGYLLYKILCILIYIYILIYEILMCFINVLYMVLGMW